MSAKSREYQRGYDAADARMLKGEDPKVLRNQSSSDLDQNDFTQGWKDACDDEILANAESDAEWERINKLTPEELDAKLLASGYTKEQVNAMIERCKEIVRKAGFTVT